MPRIFRCNGFPDGALPALPVDAAPKHGVGTDSIGWSLVTFSPSSRAFLFLLAGLLAACGGTGDTEKKGGPGTPTVGFVTARFSDVASQTELSGRVVASQQSEVRPQIAGLVRGRLFSEGGFVRAGQPLYRIDPATYRAAAAEAQANVAAAQATAEAARVRANRIRPLAEMEAVAQQDLTDALAQARQAEAAVAQNRARLDTAQINLGFTTVTAPISGRIGRSLVTEGALVTMNQAEPMAVIQRLDPIYVDIQQSGADLVALRQALARGTAAPASAEVRLTLEDGTEYGPSGTLEFAEALVDEATGTVTLRARFPNPNGLLLPGMFVRARFSQSIDRQAILVPQVAVARDERGDALVWIVGPDNKVTQRTVTATRTVGSNWVVTGGLRQGERIVTQGLANLRPGAQVRAVPANSPQRIAPPGTGNAVPPSTPARAPAAR
jgi:membrane fusion protein (multidrug efflux system)